MSPNSLPPVDQLRQLFIYEPDTGKLIWRERPVDQFKTAHACNIWNICYAGKEAGCIKTRLSGYRHIQVAFNGKRWLAHRVAFAMYYGRDPEQDIDHINRDSLDNRIENLREASRSLNLQNQTEPQKGNESGYRGVDWHNRTQKWRARITANGKNKHLGLFTTPEDAHAAYLAAKAKYHSGAIVA